MIQSLNHHHKKTAGEFVCLRFSEASVHPQELKFEKGSYVGTSAPTSAMKR